MTLYMTANDMEIATGTPIKETLCIHSPSVPVWSFSGDAANQSVAGTIPRLPEDCHAVKVEIVVFSDQTADLKSEDVYRVHLSQEDGKTDELHATPVRTPLSAEPPQPRTIELESYYAVDPDLPLIVRIERRSDDPSDTFVHPVSLMTVRITPVDTPDNLLVVHDAPGYNSWPMIQALGDKLVCAYSRGTAHEIGEKNRGVYARTSTDNGKTWSPETMISNKPDYGEVTIGKGLDANGAMLLWVRCCGPVTHHDLYRTTDGVTFSRLTTPKLDPVPMQITDIFHVPSVGMMALWFAGNYSNDGHNSWGTLISTDNGATWTQRVVESELPKFEWPTEPSVVYIGNGKILAIARTECMDETTKAAQFQLESTDYGVTWTRTRTNIGDVSLSTPSLIYDEETGLLSNYHFHRGRGVLRRRTVKADDIWGHPLDWPNPEVVALASTAHLDAGNVNAVAIQNTHFLAYYSGETPDTSVVLSVISAPTPKG